MLGGGLHSGSAFRVLEICSLSFIFLLKVEGGEKLRTGEAEAGNPRYILLNHVSLVQSLVVYIEDITRWREDMNFIFD